MHPTRQPQRLMMAFALMMPLMVSTTIRAQIDDNTNGLSDVWETAHSSGLASDADNDGDGFENRAEAAAGTDPLDSKSFPRIRELVIEPPDRLTQNWPTVAGIHYQPMVSRDMTTWSPEVRSKGPDGEIFTHDDIVVPPPHAVNE